LDDACFGSRLDAGLDAVRAATADAGFEADLDAVGLGAVGLGAPARADRSEGGREGAGTAARDDARGVRSERSDDGRPAGWLRALGTAEDVVERVLRAAGVTAVGVMLSSDLQLAGGAQVR
jgi:hypothetical protein